MPRFSFDRDGFVRRVDRRREVARWAAHTRRRIGLGRGSLQADVYDRTFRSDEEAVSYLYALRNDHLPDFENPTWVNEKVRWQFLNHPNPLMSLAADKIAVRDYLRLKGAEIAAPELFAVGTDPADLDRVDLPQRFALKSRVEQRRRTTSRTACAPTPRDELLGKLAALGRAGTTGATPASCTTAACPKRWLVEELLVPQRPDRRVQVLLHPGRAGLHPGDLRPVRPEVQLRRSSTSSGGRSTSTGAAIRRPRRRPSRPAALEQLVAEARRLSEDFLHVRVDFLQCDDRLVSPS